jgi:hypothetical protein
VAVYLSLLVHALCLYDANILYRLVGHPLVENTWRALFGGGMKKLVKLGTAPSADIQTSECGFTYNLTKIKLNYFQMCLGPDASVKKIQED